jgi:arginine/lysine/histidine transport system permease protein
MHYTFQFRDVLASYQFFIEGLIYTILLAIVAMAVAIVLGTLVAIAKNSKNRPLKTVATVFVEVTRNTPLIIQLWFVYFGLGDLGVQMSALTCGIITLSLNTAAYTAEIVRAGIDAVDREIKEACQSLGMRPSQVYRYVVIPLGFRSVLPALGNMAIQCMLATALLSVMGINDLTNQTMRVASKTFRSFEVYAIASALYLVLTFAISRLFSAIEKSLKGSLH